MMSWRFHIYKTPTQDILIDEGNGNTVEYLTNKVKVWNWSSELINSNHIGGLISVFEEIPVKLWIGVVHTSNVFENYIRLIEEENIIHTVARAGLKGPLKTEQL